MSRAYLYAVLLAALVLAVPLASGAASDLTPTPTIDSAPPNPSATGSATLSFSDADPLVTFRCQIDGGAFSLCTSPATYSGLADGSHTFGVKAVDLLLNESDVVSYTWSVDTTPPPAPTITAQPSNPSNDSSPAFQFTDTEGGVSFQCKLDSGGFAACTSPVAYTGQADGSHTFTVEATDAAGNTSSTSYSWTIDTVVPTITLGTKPPSSSSDATPTFAFSANEATPGGFECKLDNGTFAACTSPTTLGPTLDGSHTFTVRAADAAGNTGQASYTWTIDTVAPTVTLGTKPPNPSNDATPTFAFSANEATPGGFECKLDNGTFAACTSPTTLGPTLDGSHTFTVRATDAAGNTGQASYTWTIDTVAPTVTLGTKPPNPSNDPTPTFSFSAGEASTFQCQLDAGAFAPCTSPTTLGSTADGSHTFTVKATDAAGNTGQASYTWTIDTVAPTATLTAKPANPSNDPTPTFSFSAGETSTFQCQLDAGAFAPCTSPTTLGSTADGSHTYTVKATDAAGNTGPAASYVWTIDTVAPTVTLGTKPPNPSNDPTPSFSFSASETSTFQCQLDAGAFAPCTSPTTLGSTADGSHTYTVKATDAAGNTGPVTSYVWTIDTVAPTVTLSIKPPNPTNDTTPDFAFSANETVPAGFQCQLDAAAFAACTSPKALAATADGSHTFTVKAIDAAGNTGQTSYTWTIDTAAPQITLGTKPTNPTNDTTPDFAFSANETLLGGFQCQLDGAAFAACTSPKTLPATADGSHTFTVKAIDTAGNPGQTSYTWTIDTDPPTITLTQTPSNFSSDSTPTFAFTADEPIPGGFQCRLDAGGTFAPCSSPTTLSATADGPHTFTVRGNDAAGNLGADELRVDDRHGRAGSLAHGEATGSERGLDCALRVQRCRPNECHLSVSARRGGLPELHIAERLLRACERDAQLHRERHRCSREHGQRELLVVGRHGHPCSDHQPGAAEPHQPDRRDVQLHLEQAAEHVRVPARRRRIQRLHEPQDLRAASCGRPFVPGASDRRAGSHGPRHYLLVDDRPDTSAHARDQLRSGKPEQQQQPELRVHRWRVRRQLPVPAGRRRIRFVREPHGLLGPRRRASQLQRQGHRCGGQPERPGRVHVDDRHGRADDHLGHEAGRSHQRHHAGLCLQRQRDDLRRLPVQARRRRLRRLHEPEDASLRPQTDRTPSR